MLIESKSFGKIQKTASRTAWEIDAENVSGALREHAATEKSGEEAGARSGARFFNFGRSGPQKAEETKMACPGEPLYAQGHAVTIIPCAHF